MGIYSVFTSKKRAYVWLETLGWTPTCGRRVRNWNLCYFHQLSQSWFARTVSTTHCSGKTVDELPNNPRFCFDHTSLELRTAQGFRLIMIGWCLKSKKTGSTSHHVPLYCLESSGQRLPPWPCMVEETFHCFWNVLKRRPQTWDDIGLKYQMPTCNDL